MFFYRTSGRSILTAATYKCSFAFRDTGRERERERERPTRVSRTSRRPWVTSAVSLYRFFAIRSHDVAIVPTLMFISDVPPTVAPIGPPPFAAAKVIRDWLEAGPWVRNFLRRWKWFINLMIQFLQNFLDIKYYWRKLILRLIWVWNKIRCLYTIRKRLGKRI